MLINYSNNPLVNPLISYHNAVTHTFSPIEQTGRHYAAELAKRVATVVIAPLAYYVLGLIALVGMSLHRTIVNTQANGSSEEKNSDGADVAPSLEKETSEEADVIIPNRKSGSRDFLQGLSMQEYIENFVASFLHPYITGQITRDDEPENRRSMMELLLEEIGTCTDDELNEIEEIAFNAYLEKAALGLYMHCGIGKSARDLEPESERFEALVEALREAIPKDFPLKEISDEELREKAAKALLLVNEKRRVAEREALNYERPNYCNPTSKRALLEKANRELEKIV